MKSTKWMCAILLSFVGVGSAGAFTCDDVRALSAEQRAYYIVVFNITPAQQERIRHACSGARVRQAASTPDERPTIRYGRGQQEAHTAQ